MPMYSATLKRLLMNQVFGLSVINSFSVSPNNRLPSENVWVGGINWHRQFMLDRIESWLTHEFPEGYSC